MTIENLRVPKKGFTKAERAWLEELVKAIKTVHGVAGRHVTITNGNEGQLINADDCAPGQ